MKVEKKPFRFSIFMEEEGNKMIEKIKQEERRRIREELDRGKKSKITWMMYDGVVWLREKEVLALLSDEKFQVMNKEEASIDRYLELERRYGEEKGK